MLNRWATKRTWGPDPYYPRAIEYTPPETQKPFTIIAGPCSVESEEQIFFLAREVSAIGATHLRGGVFRAGTYPKSDNFGLVNEELLAAYSGAAKEFGLKNIIEVLDYSEDQLNLLSKYCSCFQVGARSMQNYTLLQTLPYYEKPIFLKRHPGCTIDEWLGSAEYLLKNGAKEIYLVERGSVSHMNHVRWDLSVSSIPAVAQITKIPVICDASHGTGRRDLVGSMTLAGIAAGAGGILVEVHNHPDLSLSDADQAIGPMDFYRLMVKANKVRKAIESETC